MILVGRYHDLTRLSSISDDSINASVYVVLIIAFIFITIAVIVGIMKLGLSSGTSLSRLLIVVGVCCSQ